MPKNAIDPNAVVGSLAQREAQARPFLVKARAALERGELALAMLHTSDALALQPNLPDSLQLIDEIARQSEEPLDLAPLSVSVALTACRARVLALQGDLDWAIVLVRHVVAAAPTLECVQWVRDWLTQAAIVDLGLDALKGSLIMLLKLWADLPPGLDTNDPRLPNVRATADVVAQVRAQFPDQGPLYTAEVLLRRRLGEPSVTLAVARDAVERFPEDWAVLSSMANAERDAKNPDAALRSARRAMDVDPSDGSPLHDAAWGYWEAERPVEARALFEELLEDFPDYPLGPDARKLVDRSSTGH